MFQFILNPLGLNLVNWLNLTALHTSPNVPHFKVGFFFFKVIWIIFSGLELHNNFGYLKYLYLITMVALENPNDT